jgi:hypothetical protein
MPVFAEFFFEKSEKSFEKSKNFQKISEKFGKS